MTMGMKVPVRHGVSGNMPDASDSVVSVDSAGLLAVHTKNGLNNSSRVRAHNVLGVSSPSKARSMSCLETEIVSKEEAFSGSKVRNERVQTQLTLISLLSFSAPFTEIVVFAEFLAP